MPSSLSLFARIALASVSDHTPRSGPAAPSLYEVVGVVPTVQTDTEPATPTNPPPMLTA